MAFNIYISLIWILINLTFIYILKLSIAPVWWLIKAISIQLKYIFTEIYLKDKSLNKKEIIFILKEIVFYVFIKIKKNFNEINYYTNQIYEVSIDLNNYLNEVGWFLLSEWIGNTESKIKNKMQNAWDIILNKKNYTVSYRLYLIYKKIKSLKLIIKIIIIYILFLILIRGATINELPSYSVLFILSLYNPNIKLKVSKADVIWWKIKCFFIRNFTNMKEPENPMDIRAKEISEYMNKNKIPSELEQRELYKLSRKKSKLHKNNISFIDGEEVSENQQQVDIPELTDDEKRLKAKEIESIIHQMFGKDESDYNKPIIIEDNKYEKFEWVFDLFDFI